MTKKRFLLTSLLILQLFITLIFGGTIGYLFDKKTMNPVLKIGDKLFINVSEKAVYSDLKLLFNKEIVISGHKIPINLVESQKRVSAWVNEQYDNSPPQEIVTGLLGYLNPYWRIKTYSEPLYLNNEVIELLKTVKSQIDKVPKPAKLSYKDNQLMLIPAEEGRVVNIQETLQKIESIESLSADIPIVFEKITPSLTTEDLMPVKDLIGDYTTYFNPLVLGRTTNIRLSADALNGRILSPNDILSFNLEVGERAKEKGYLPADIYLDNAIARDYGGGVCQTVSTLYQAVIQGNLEIVERHQHTLPVDYVPSKGDATVAYGKLDFKFRNDTSSYLLVSTETGTDYIRVRLFARADTQHPPTQNPGTFPNDKFPQNPLHK